MAVETYSKSEEDVEQQMYKAMANKMQHDGTDVAAEAIAQTVKELFPLSPPEPTEEEEELAEKIAAYFMTVFQPSEDYVVRGALLRCQFGSHCRRLNLRRCHGVYILNKPLVSKQDCKGGAEGADINVTSFGICSCSGKSAEQIVHLKKEAPRYSNGSFTGETTDEIISGPPCIPDILDTWDNTHAETHIGEENEEALTTRSFLVCSYGGLIEIIRSGQEDDD